ncbi:MAG: GNAT family N-acetyltransferase [Ktedonobacterales bacterium]
MVALETERLALRAFGVTDWDALNAILSDPLVTRYMHFATWDEKRRRAWLAKIVHEAHHPHDDVYNWAITLRHTSMVIGWLGIGGTTHPSGPRARVRLRAQSSLLGI